MQRDATIPANAYMGIEAKASFAMTFLSCSVAMMDKEPVLNKLSALSHAGRLEVFRLLVSAGTSGMNAGDIAQQLDLRPNTLSAHLTMLSTADLITARREGRNIRYFAELSAMRDLLGFLMQDCCGGSPDICGKVLDSLRVKW